MRKNHVLGALAVFVLTAALQADDGAEKPVPYAKINAQGNHRYAIAYYADPGLTQPIDISGYDKTTKFARAIAPMREEL